MKKINFNLKDRKVLTLGLCLILVCVFTLTVAYAALNAVLNIQGNAKVNSANWDIYLSNARVKNGSVTTNLPIIKSNNLLEFSTTLNMPGDFYEFTVDVVNGGSIDALIENVVKTPDLTVEQAKFLKYEVSYQNGESIATKQLLAKGTTTPIKVRIEYRNDLISSDLPTGQVVLDLSLTLEYIQSDGTGNSVLNNGAYDLVRVVSGNVDAVGSEICIEEECFYVISSDSDSVALFAKYNLNVGNIVDSYYNIVPIENPTGIQDINSVGYKFENGQYYYPFIGTTAVYDDTTNFIDNYMNNYKQYLTSKGVNIMNIRYISLDEVEAFGCIEDDYCNSDTPSWIYSTSYWAESYRVMHSDGYLEAFIYDMDDTGGVRPVIEISKDYF